MCPASSFFNKYANYIFWLLFGSLSIVIYFQTINLVPMYMHSWAQSDRYSVTLNFIMNGFDFFHPATHNLNSINGITGVEFPIHNFIIAFFMKLIGNNSPWIHRLYVIIYSLIGLFFLFKLGMKYTNSLLKSLLAILIIYFCPIFLFYQNNFLFNHVGFANTSIAIYYFHTYLVTKFAKHLYISIFFFTFATLTKTSFGLYFLAYFLYYLYSFLYKRNEKDVIEITSLQHIGLFVSGFGINYIYYEYNNFLNKTYNSYIFTNSGNMFQDIYQAVYETGPILRGHLFFIIPYTTIILVASLFIFIGSRKGLVISQNKFILGTTITIGLLSIYYALGNQYKIHDYYFIEITYLPLFFLSILLFKEIEMNTKNKLVSATIILFVGASCYKGYVSYSERLNFADESSSHINIDFKDEDVYMKSLGIKEDEAVAVLEPFSTNQIFVHLHRRGKTIDYLNQETINLLKNSNCKYFVIQNRNFEKHKDELELYKDEIKCLLDNKRYMVFQLI